MASAYFPCSSIARIVNLNMSSTSGAMPVTYPVALFRVTPFGRSPETTSKWRRVLSGSWTLCKLQLYIMTYAICTINIFIILININAAECFVYISVFLYFTSASNFMFILCSPVKVPKNPMCACLDQTGGKLFAICITMVTQNCVKRECIWEKEKLKWTNF